MWNLLYVLRWAMIQDRLEHDIKKYNIKNVHMIKFEKIVMQDKEEVELLQDILQVSGKLKMPTPPKSEVLKYKSTILPNLADEKLVAGAENILGVIYQMCKPYLERHEYAETIETFEKLRIAK